MFRNREIRRFAALLCALSAAFAAAGFALGPQAGWLVLAACAALSAAFFAFTRMRYRRIAALCDQIDAVLHHDDRLLVSESEEGELSILQSEIVKMTLRIREQNEALRREKGRLADSLADIAHQLRTPLTSSSLILTLVQSAEGEEERKALLRQAEELFMHMDSLITSLLRLSRLDAGIVTFHPKPVSVRELVDAALRPLLIPLELRGIDVQIDVPGDAVLTADALWLSEAIGNLLKNGMDSAGAGGRLAVACEENPIYTEITVRDSGPGFEAGELPRLFDRFYRGKGAGSLGYGIGLALCKTVVVRQGGTIQAKNHPQGGALFSIRFPK
ncbi:MAG: HAMP domain-containing sensor histidine kinase [Clostridia bacterium]|nr:HAMP domain-containing sensor histidine kinase [Clostridia bacterium]